MTNNIDQVLNRGEKLDNLVTKSEQLGDQVWGCIQSSAIRSSWPSTTSTALLEKSWWLTRTKYVYKMLVCLLSIVGCQLHAMTCRLASLGEMHARSKDKCAGRITR